uniref:SH3 domain-containing protein n=1 Tax=Eptatretus burgeri TaxID=7764 RepID=A0A8C4NLB1_EPTBU
MRNTTLVARALYDNVAETPDELSFHRGDIITVHEQNTGGLRGWWLCSLHGKHGVAPGNRLRLLVGAAVPPALQSQLHLQLHNQSPPIPIGSQSRSHSLTSEVIYQVPVPFPQADTKTRTDHRNIPLRTTNWDTEDKDIESVKSRSCPPDVVSVMKNQDSLYDIPSAFGKRPMATSNSTALFCQGISQHLDTNNGIYDTPVPLNTSGQNHNGVSEPSDLCKDKHTSDYDIPKKATGPSNCGLQMHGKGSDKIVTLEPMQYVESEPGEFPQPVNDAPQVYSNPCTFQLQPEVLCAQMITNQVSHGSLESNDRSSIGSSNSSSCSNLSERLSFTNMDPLLPTSLPVPQPAVPEYQWHARTKPPPTDMGGGQTFHACDVTESTITVPPQSRRMYHIEDQIELIQIYHFETPAEQDPNSFRNICQTSISCSDSHLLCTFSKPLFALFDAIEACVTQLSPVPPHPTPMQLLESGRTVAYRARELATATEKVEGSASQDNLRSAAHDLRMGLERAAVAIEKSSKTVALHSPMAGLCERARALRDKMAASVTWLRDPC